MTHTTTESGLSGSENWTVCFFSHGTVFTGKNDWPANITIQACYLVFKFLKTRTVFKPVPTEIFVANDKIGLSKKNYIHRCELDGNKDLSDENGSEINCDFFLCCVMSTFEHLPDTGNQHSPDKQWIMSQNDGQ